MRSARGLLLLAGLLVGALAGAAPAPSPEELEALRGRIRALQAELDAARGTQDREREKLRTTEVQIGNLTRDRQRIESDLAHHEKRLTELQRERAAQVRAIVPEAVTTAPDGQPALDLRAGIVARLAELGVGGHLVGGCTAEDPALYSHRRDRVTGRQGAAVVMVAAT